MSRLYVMGLLSAVDGSLVTLAATGAFSRLTDVITIGLVVLAGAGTWIAAQDAMRQADRTRWLHLATLGALTLAATLASVWLGTRLEAALTLHALPKAAGLVFLLFAAETVGLRVPAVRRIPTPVAVLAAGGILEAVWMST